MTTRKSRNNIETYLGKIRDFNGDEVIVSLWDNKQEERVCNLSRKYFPVDDLEVGQIFRYRAKIALEIIPSVELSSGEITRLYRNIKRRLP